MPKNLLERHNEDEWDNPHKIERILRLHFLSPTSMVNRLDYLANLKQNKGESIINFADRVETVSNRYSHTTPTDFDLLTTFMHGLIHPIKMHLIAKSPLTFIEAITLAKKKENDYNLHNNDNIIHRNNYNKNNNNTL